MPDDQVRTADTRAWLVKATNDLLAADVDLAKGTPLLEDALFHCQQAVEKALKAFLTWHDQPFRRTHDLLEVGERCAGIDPSLEPFVSRVQPLTGYAWKYRYSGEALQPTVEQVKEVLSLAREVVGAVLERLPREAHP